LQLASFLLSGQFLIKFKLNSGAKNFDFSKKRLDKQWTKAMFPKKEICGFLQDGQLNWRYTETACAGGNDENMVFLIIFKKMVQHVIHICAYRFSVE
jgi:hypothetical protein